MVGWTQSEKEWQPMLEYVPMHEVGYGEAPLRMLLGFGSASGLGRLSLMVRAAIVLGSELNSGSGLGKYSLLINAWHVEIKYTAEVPRAYKKS